MNMKSFLPILLVALVISAPEMEYKAINKTKYIPEGSKEYRYELRSYNVFTTATIDNIERNYGFERLEDYIGSYGEA